MIVSAALFHSEVHRQVNIIDRDVRYECKHCTYLLDIKHPISLIISRTFLHENSHVKNGVRLTIEMRLTFGIFVKLTVRHAHAYAIYTNSHSQGFPDLAEGKFETQ